MVIAGLFGALGVIAGAFGAHGLSSRGVSAEAMGWWETGAKYHLVHAAAMLAAALGVAGVSSGGRRWLAGAVWCWAGGVVVFSGSLYVMTLTGQRWLGAVTPIGGLALIGGWVLVMVSGWRLAGSDR